MQKPTFDPGLTQQYGGPLRRVIKKVPDQLIFHRPWISFPSLLISPW